MPEEKPNLEQIASEIGQAEEDYKMKDLENEIMYQFLDKSRQPDGSYKTKFSDEEKKDIANTLFDTLSYHVHVNVYKRNPKDWMKENKEVGPRGERPGDDAVLKYFGVTRQDFQKEIDDQVELNQEVLSRLMQKKMQTFDITATQQSYQKLDESHVPYMKEWMKGKVKEYDMDENLLEQVDKSHTLRDLRAVYTGIAKAHYKKKITDSN